MILTFIHSRFDIVVALTTLTLHLHCAQVFFVIVVDVEDIDDGVGTAHEVRVIGINVRVLDLYQVSHHLVARAKLLGKKCVHGLNNLLLQVLETSKLLHLDLHDDSSQLFVDKLNALERWGF